MKNISIALMLICSFAACVKHDKDKYLRLPDASASLSSPVEGSSFRKGDSILISGVAISTANMHGYDIAIRKLNDTTTYFFYHSNAHNDTLVVNHKWKDNISGSAILQAELTFHLDHDGNTLVKRVRFNSAE